MPITSSNPTLEKLHDHIQADTFSRESQLPAPRTVSLIGNYPLVLLGQLFAMETQDMSGSKRAALGLHGFRSLHIKLASVNPSSRGRFMSSSAQTRTMDFPRSWPTVRKVLNANIRQ